MGAHDALEAVDRPPSAPAWPHQHSPRVEQHALDHRCNDSAATVARQKWYAAYVIARQHGKNPDEAARDATLHMERTRGSAAPARRERALGEQGERMLYTTCYGLFASW